MSTEPSRTAIVAFHISRGGKFNNPGHITYLGEKRIGEFISNLSPSYANASKVANIIGDRPNLQWLFSKAFDGDIAAQNKLISIGLPLGETIYLDDVGDNTGLTQSDVDTGIGRIDIDGIYNTTYSKRLMDCSDAELALIDAALNR